MYADKRRQCLDFIIAYLCHALFKFDHFYADANMPLKFVHRSLCMCIVCPLMAGYK